METNSVQVQGWEKYLPPTLQINTVYFVVLFCLMVTYFYRRLPIERQSPFIEQAVVTICAIGILVPLMPGSTVYALGTAVITAGLSTLFYTLLLNWIINKIHGWLGVTPKEQNNP